MKKIRILLFSVTCLLLTGCISSENYFYNNIGVLVPIAQRCSGIEGDKGRVGYSSYVYSEKHNLRWGLNIIINNGIVDSVEVVYNKTPLYENKDSEIKKKVDITSGIMVYQFVKFYDFKKVAAYKWTTDSRTIGHGNQFFDYQAYITKLNQLLEKLDMPKILIDDISFNENIVKMEYDTRKGHSVRGQYDLIEISYGNNKFHIDKEKTLYSGEAEITFSDTCYNDE